MRTTAVALLLAATLSLTACSGGGDGSSSAGKSPVTPTSPAPPSSPSADAPLGKGAETVGSGGTGRLAVTPTSAVYAAKAIIDKPSRGLFVVVTVKDRAVTAVAAAETAPIERGGWQWIAPDGQTVTTVDGNASNVALDGFNHHGPVQPGAFTWRTEAFDISEAQRGGTLVYTDGLGTAYRWKIPAQDAGPQVDEVKRLLAG
ncbi:hypothetical protein ACFY97_18965 [Streptomyces klenkii]|uniref:hypothetical protein n=1 Tax=Streptomyces klenkii TaxID=1420899 RepID=UPI0036E21DC4